MNTLRKSLHVALEYLPTVLVLVQVVSALGIRSSSCLNK